MSSQYISLHLVAWGGGGGGVCSGGHWGAPGSGDGPPDPFTQTFNTSVLFIFISVKLTVVNLGVAGGQRWSGGWRRGFHRCRVAWFEI